MRTYKISKSTAAKAMALLSDIGLIHTIEKKGTVLRSSEEPAPVRIEQNIIADNLTLFLNVLQILAVCSQKLSFAAFSPLDDSALADLGALSGRPHVIDEQFAVLAQEGFEQFELARESLRKSDRENASVSSSGPYIWMPVYIH